MKKISACICTYNRYDLLPKAVDSLLNQKSKYKYEIIIVDNSPENPNVEYLRKKYQSDAKIKYIWLDTPGLSNARNHAVKIAESEFISYMDDDAIASPAWLEKIVDAFEFFGQEVVCVGGKVIPIWEIPRPEWMHEWLNGYVSIVDWGDGKVARYAREHEWMAGTNISFRISFLKEYGLFDTKLGRNGDGSVLLSNEEIKISESIKQNGFKTVYSEDASVQHLVPKERLTQEWFRRRVLWQSISDFMSNKNALLSNISNMESLGLEFLYNLHPKDRNVFGIFEDVKNGREFVGQLKAIEAIVSNVLLEKKWDRG